MRDPFSDENLSISVYPGMEGLEHLRTPWRDVVAGMTRRHFFHLWEWYYSYLKCLAGNPNRLLFFLVTRGKTPLAILPLQFTPISLGGVRLRALTFPAHDHLLLWDLICCREAHNLPLFELLGRHLRNERQSWDLIQLPHLLQDACALQVLDNYPPSKWLLKSEERCDFIDTTVSHDHFLSGLSKNFRKNLKRARQNLDELPRVQFSITSSGPELDRAFEAFLDVEASGWKGSGGSGTAIRLDPALRCFYHTLAHTLCASGQVSIHTLTADGNCIAAQFCLRLDRTAYILKIGYDEDYRRCAPGNLLKDFFIRQSMAEGSIREINLITDAEWHRDWKVQSYAKSRAYIFNTTPAGLVGYGMLKSYPVLKKGYLALVKPLLPRPIQEWIERLPRET
jgi:hypothetical protein